MSSPTASTTYDDLVYPSLAFPQTHPDLLRTLGTLFGLHPAPVEQCRVLELGCASGTNVLSLAHAWPNSQFLGIDYSLKQIEEGKKRLEQLKLPNVELRHASILEVDESYGEFDYILCHGVYSWVPQQVQDAILRIYARHLKPEGIGYISYNTLPGWHMRGMIREMMCYHDTWHQKSPPLERVRQARALLQFLTNASRNQNTPYALLLRQELEILQKVSDSYIFHEHLEEHNDPIYFFEFYERLIKHNLRFLGEADFRSMVHENLPGEVRQQLASVAPNLIQMEQYLDFLSNRMFRQSLVCHEHHRPSYNLSPERIQGFLVACPLKPSTHPVDLFTQKQESFQGAGGISIGAGDPIVKAALLCLADAWPLALPFAQLFEKARQKLGSHAASDVERDRLELSATLLKLYSIGGTALVEFWSSYPSFICKVSDKPVANPLARVLARESNTVPTLRHQCLTIGDLDRQIIPMLDGTQTRTTIRNTLLEAFRKKTFTLAKNGQPIQEEHQARPVLTEAIDTQLTRYAETGILIG